MQQILFSTNCRQSSPNTQNKNGMPFQRKEKNLDKLLLMSMTKYGLEENSDRQKYKLLQVQTTHVLATIHSSEIETKRSQ